MALSGLAAAMRGGWGNPQYKPSYKGGQISYRPGRNPLVRVGAWGHVTYPKGANVSQGGTPPGGIAPPRTGAGGAGAASGQASPLDSTYYQNVAQNEFSTNNQINALNMRQSNASTNLQSQLAQLAHQEPLDQLHLEQQANSRGSLYSTPYGQQLGQLNYGYLGRQGAAQNNYGQLVASIASQIAGLRGGEQLYNSGQYEAAAERAALAAQKNPAVGESSASLTNPAASGQFHNAPARNSAKGTGGRHRSGRSRLAASIALGRRGGF